MSKRAHAIGEALIGKKRFSRPRYVYISIRAIMPIEVNSSATPWVSASFGLVQKHLRHANINTTQVYADVCSADRREGLERAFGGG